MIIIIRLFAVVWSKLTFRPKKEVDRQDRPEMGQNFVFIVQSQDLD